MKKILLCLYMIFVIGCQYNKEGKAMNINIEDQNFILNVYDNETTAALTGLLPLDLTLQQLNNNEQYVYLEENLPGQSSSIGHIQTGDVMLFGNNCLVIFYKDFNTSYQYTPIGHIDNLDVSLMESSTIHIRLEE